MIFFFLEKIRKLFKSVGKKELKINDLITYRKFESIKEKYSINLESFNPNNTNAENSKIVASIAFFYDEKKLTNLKKVCKNLYEISNETEIYVFTNKISEDEKKRIEHDLKSNIKIIVIEDILHNRLLPWYHLNLMRKLYERKDITHFLYLEDDILISKENFDYWVNGRKILKDFNLIPGFIRTEINHETNELYAIDFVKKNKLKNLPEISINHDYSFINHKYPYQGMYLYDRELMKEHLFGPSSNPDCGHGAFNTDYIDPRMINLDLMAKANIGLTYLNVPDGFFNRLLTLYNKKEKSVDAACQIKHLSNKYSNSDSMFGNIKVRDSIS